MKKTGMTRPLDSLGRIVVPKEIRASLDYVDGDSVEFFIDNENGVLAFRKYTGMTCKMCGALDNLSYFKESFICDTCIHELKNDTHEIVLSESKCETQSVTSGTPRRVQRRSKDKQIEQLQELMQTKPNATQMEYAKSLGVAQSRISHLKKFMIEQQLIKN
ncbi:regulator (plasmid) [Paenibacillus peoriae]|uniref:AbrB/MazE/SpoVT family DNA-binding domain-containing protein n=1 Tax=Paenibacillus peoriae TaxID=59893 RepID=UPI0007218B1A|nr:AbrB/MazE/SpoVT family DNA-binding domain-containing protein [Paenibacillus peoriae]ALS09907.1 regulator [Paenibacillus peoriae]